MKKFTRIITSLLLSFGISLSATSVDKQEFKQVLETKHCPDCNLSNLINLTRKDLRNANLIGANLSDSWLHQSDLRNADLSNSNARRTRFNNTDLRGVNFSNADVTSANFCGADLRGINWQGVIYDNTTQCMPSNLSTSSTITASNTNLSGW
ncbi:MAG: pentapeptide repeat-containing protein [Xenococcaceae cyanobacterium MO_207.B15]|nr:pentapeptide repeat-containing protein [Xenococcaceae cyanobacterium MO_207.B15]MDJ0745493.1 pentapeptide repeat-containing protein [Xenococcaceae cyanobacterium MO_167.B27]